ncbi:phage tail spike protein [Ligilactobacillus saerimneri]
MSTGYLVTIRKGWDGQEEILNSNFANGARLSSAVISKSVTEYDSFTFTIDPSHPWYAKIEPYQDFVKVYRPDKNLELFNGRVLTYSDSMDTAGLVQKTVVCEGLEGFLHDSVQPWAEFHNTTPADFLKAIITNHNGQVEDYKKIRVKQATVTNSTDNVYRYLDDAQDTYDTIQDKLISRIGGELKVKWGGDMLDLYYEPTIGKDATQSIILTNNLLSSSRSIDPTEVVTVLKPLGATQERNTDENSSVDTSSPRLTIKSVNNGSEFLRDEGLISEFGIRVKAQAWDDVTTPQALISKGREFLQNQKAIKHDVQVSYVDFSYLEDVDMIECGDFITVINPVQGLQLTERIVTMSLDLLAIENSTVTLSNQPLNLKFYRDEYRREQLAESELFTKLLKEQQQDTSDLRNKLMGSQKEVADLKSELANIVKRLDDYDNTKPQPAHIGKIIDVSEWQGVIDWPSVIADDVSLSIIRVQDGSSHQDLKYMENIQKCISAGGKYAVYAYFRAVSTADAQQEAKDFYNRTQRVVAGKQQPLFYAIDVESIEMGGDVSQMRAGVEAYMSQLNALGIPDSKIVLYIANHLYDKFNLNVARAGAIWIPSYGMNDGTLANSLKPSHNYDLWQYSSKYRISGITGDVDINTDPSDRFKAFLQ